MITFFAVPSTFFSVAFPASSTPLITFFTVPSAFFSNAFPASSVPLTTALAASSDVVVKAFVTSSAFWVAVSATFPIPFPARSLDMPFPIALKPTSIPTVNAASTTPCFVPSHIILPVEYVSSKLATPLASYSRCCC